MYSFDLCMHSFKRVQPAVWAGDEPHYLLMVSSLLNDGDLLLGNNYQSMRVGGLDAGRNYCGGNLDHHTVIVDSRTGEMELWQNIFSLRATECSPGDLSCVGYKRTGPHLQDYSPTNAHFIERPWHAVPFPALVAGLLKITGATPNELEPRAIYIVVFISWLAGILTYLCGLKLDLGPKGSLLAVSLLYYASPWLVYSHQLFAATFLGFWLVLALWALLRRQFIVAAISVTICSMQSEAFLLIIPAWVLFLYLSKEKRSSWVFAMAAVAATVAASLINHFLLGKISLRQMWFVFDPVLWRAFTDRNHGLFLFVPWTIVVFGFLVIVLIDRRRKRNTDLIGMAAGILPMVAIYALLPDTSGYCYGPRYWIPYLPWFSLLFILFSKRYWHRHPIVIRSTLILLVALSTITVISAAILVPSAVLFWYEPPWYSSRAITDSYRQPYLHPSCFGRDLQVSLGSSCGDTVGKSAAFDLPKPINATALAIVSRLACSTGIPDNTEVVQIRLFDANGTSESANLLAGRDSSEWAYDCSDIKTRIRHRRATVFSSYDAGLDNQPCQGHRYAKKLVLSKVQQVKRVELQWVGGPAAIILDKLSLIDERGGISYAIDPSLLRP